MQKIIVTHTNPDLDAVAAVWIVKRFWKGWEQADMQFVPAGETWLPNKMLVEGEQIVHLDTGFGPFDHHQSNEDTCAAKKTWEHARVATSSRTVVAAVDRLASVVNTFDHFRNVYFPQSADDFHDFSLVYIIEGLNMMYNEKGNGDIQVVDFGLNALDAVFKTLVNKVRAEHEIEAANPNAFDTVYGKALVFEIGNDSVIKVAQRMGYTMAVRKDPKKGYLRIKALPDKGIDLTSLYEALKKADPDATWYLHPSKTMLLNGTTKNPSMRPTKLTLNQIVGIMKRIE